MYNYPQSGYFNREDDDAVSATQTVDIHAAGIVGILSAPQEDADAAFTFKPNVWICLKIGYPQI